MPPGTGEAGVEAACLNMTGEIRDGVDFRVRGEVWCRGGRRRVVDGRKLLCEGVTEALFAVDIGVSAFGRSAAEECGHGECKNRAHGMTCFEPT